jgi:penicillin amidase
MRYLSFLIWSFLTIGLCYFLSTPIGQLPALGNIVSPSHGFWRLLEGDLPALPEEVIHEQLKAEVTVVWDEHLIPHIYAQNDEDLYFVQGYITASMRLWQMDFQNRAASGRLSEIVGEAALDFDLKTRRMGMELGNEKNFAATMQDPYARMTYEQYAKGVNAYLNTLEEKDWPLEYRLLDMEPESWSAFKTIQIATFAARPSTAEPNHDIAYTNFWEAYGFLDWEMLYGGLDTDEDPIVDAPGTWDFEPVTSKAKALDIIKAPHDLQDKTEEDLIGGSNNWAISPKRSATGNALLANDPHVPLSMPNGSFITHLHSPNINIMGFVRPGVPSPLGAFNDSIAYGATNAQRNLSDWYRVKFKDDSKTKIMVDEKEVSVNRKIQEIKIKGEEAVYDTIYYSDFGVIANHSELTAKENEGWAYRWIAQDTSRVGVAIIDMTKASNWDEFSRATDKFESPHLNWAYADTRGNVGIRVTGKTLVRQDTEGLFLRDGTKSENIWTEYIPVEHTIEQYNPERGFVSSANQFPADSTYPYVINAWLYESKRNRHINQVLAADSSVTVQDMMQLQMDTYNLEASENLDYFLSMLDYENLDSKEKIIFDDLKNWDYRADPEVTAQAYYKLWSVAIRDLAWDELDTDGLSLVNPTMYRTQQLLKEQPNLKWWDIDSTAVIEDASILIKKAYKKMISEADKWQSENKGLEFNWANVKGTSLTHFTQLKPLSRENLFVGGDVGIVNASTNNFGAGNRLIVELRPEGPKAWGALAGGQSGNPGSMWYGNLTEPWSNGEYFELDLYYSAENSQRLFISTFKPTNK